MGLGSTAALAGLSKNIDYAAQNQREFAQMEIIERDIAKDKQANMMAQELESKQYEEIANKAAEMLGPDRVKIQSKSLEMQKQIRAKVEEYGSRKAFFENGGIALLSKYKSELLTSPETLSYTDNKKNMEQLMKIMAEGKGHLISENDKRSLENYNAGVGDGKISYSGMKSEVVIPEKYYNYGEDVPAEIILKSNYLQIYNNWLLDNPELQHLTGESLKEQLRDYTFKNHYGQGTNMLKYQNDLAEESLRKQQKALRSAGTGSDEEKESEETSFVAEMNYAFKGGESVLPMTLENVMDDDNYIQKMASKNPQVTALAGKIVPYNDIASNYTYAPASLWGQNSLGDVITKKTSRALGFDNKFQVAGAAVVPIKKQKEVIEYFFPGSANANDIKAALNQSEYYSPDGEKLKKDFIDDQKQDQSMKFEGLIYGFLDSQDKLVTKKLDSKGRPLSKKDENNKLILDNEDKKHRDIYSGNLTQEMFAVLSDSDGRKIYKRLGSDSLIAESELNEAFGSSNNISSEKKERTKKVVAENQKLVQANWDAKVVKSNVAAASSDGQIFSTPEFRSEAQITKVADGTNRYTLHKAYYMALSAITDRNGQKGDFTPETMLRDGYYLKNNPNNFEKAVNYSPELKNALINKNKYSDIDFINLMAKVTAGGNQEDFEENQILAQNWTKFYELLKKK